MKVSVIGAGSWGTALSQVLANNGHNVGLWARKPEVVKAINSEHRNPRYLSDVELNPDIVATLSYRDTLLRARAAVIVTPSTLVRGAARALADVVDSDFPVIVCSKGIEEGSGLLPIDILDAEMGNRSRFAVLSGPNHAEEVVRGVPAATVIASESPDTAAFFQEMFACESFRAYTSEDACGVELCAAFKNVVAIAVGMSYGLGFGDNTAALLVSRGLAEMSRLVVACGGNAITCMGLAESNLFSRLFAVEASAVKPLCVTGHRSVASFGVARHAVGSAALLAMLITQTGDGCYAGAFTRASRMRSVARPHRFPPLG